MIKRIIFGIMAGALLMVSLPALADHRGGGHWYYGHHDGWLGWWWVVPAGAWYYSTYPYPYPYVPPVTVINQEPAVVAPQESSQAQVWYYCDSAKGYYPYVPSCSEAWRTVPAEPPQAAPH